MLQLLKDNLLKDQKRIKFYADRKRSEKVFHVGDIVYLKIQRYKQTSISLIRNLKLNSKYCGPYPVLD